MNMTDGNCGLRHFPVLSREILREMIPEHGPLKVIDGTVGYGGHSSLILKKNPEAVLLGIDRDCEALENARKILMFAGERVRLMKDCYSNLVERAAENGWFSADVVLLDLGISSPQIDSPERGFSYSLDGPLDMRMAPESGKTAADILNSSGEGELERIFREYGEIRESRRLARVICADREIGKRWNGTADFADFCNRILGRRRRPGLQAATLCFQALRIAVNNELKELEKALPLALEVLAPGGKIAVISFHSLEDRIVKNFFRRESKDCLCPPENFTCICGHRKRLELITKKPITAEPDEIEENRRSSSAKLRIAEKIKYG